jgi:hypothetical protein
MKLRKTISLRRASKRMQYLRINLRKYVQNLHAENCKTSWNKVEEDLSE